MSLTFHWLFHLEFHLSKINRDIDETILETSYETQDYDEIYDKFIFLSETRREEEKRKERESKTKIIRSEQITSKAWIIDPANPIPTLAGVVRPHSLGKLSGN